MADTALALSNGNGKVKRFKAGPQITVGAGGSQPSTTRIDDKEFPDMLLDPTIALGVKIMTAILLQQPWSVECEDEGYGSFVWGQLEPYRKFLIRSTLMGFLKKGYRIYEVLYGIEEVEETFTEEEEIPADELRLPPPVPVQPPKSNIPTDGNKGKQDPNTQFPVIQPPALPQTRVVTKTRKVLRQVIAGIKSLRPEFTEILLDKDTGDLLGCENTDSNGNKVKIDKDHTIFINLDDEGYGAYGIPMLRTMQGAYRKYNLCEKGAQRYDEKVAGGFLWLTHPVGSSPFDGSLGLATAPETDNSIICDKMAKSMRGVGYACVPRAEDDNGKPIEGWTAQFLNDGGMQHSFIDRLKYLDGLKLRGVGIPERSATEGSFGTKAEAEAHANVALMVNEQLHERIIDTLNPQLLEPLNRSNTGDPGLCRVNLGKLDPDSRELFSAIFTALMQDPLFGEEIIRRVDGPALMDTLKIPIKQTTDFSEGPDDA